MLWERRKKQETPGKMGERRCKLRDQELCGAGVVQGLRNAAVVLCTSLFLSLFLVTISSLEQR